MHYTTFHRIHKKTIAYIITFIALCSYNTYVLAAQLGAPSYYTDGRLLITAGYHDNSTQTVNNKNITVIGFSNGDVKWIGSLSSSTRGSNWNDLGIIGSDLLNPCVKQITVTNWGSIVVAYTNDTKGKLVRRMASWQYGAKGWEGLSVEGLPNEHMIALIPGDSVYYVEAVFKSGIYGYNSSKASWIKLITPPAGEYIYSISNEGDDRSFAYSTQVGNVYSSQIGSTFANSIPKAPGNNNLPISSISKQKNIVAIVRDKDLHYVKWINGIWNIWKSPVMPREYLDKGGDVFIMPSTNNLVLRKDGGYTYVLPYGVGNWETLSDTRGLQANETFYEYSSPDSYVGISEAFVEFKPNKGAAFGFVYAIPSTDVVK